MCSLARVSTALGVNHVINQLWSDFHVYISGLGLIYLVFEMET
jgi:hypothetical protein